MVEFASELLVSHWIPRAPARAKDVRAQPDASPAHAQVRGVSCR
jgi:hypothetical protein